MSMLETSDGSERIFFTLAQLVQQLITSLKDFCQVLKPFFLDYMGGFLYCLITQDIGVLEMQ